MPDQHHPTNDPEAALLEDLAFLDTIAALAALAQSPADPDEAARPYLELARTLADIFTEPNG